MAHEILIVEDDTSTQTLLSKLLEKLGTVNSTVVSSAEEALEVLQTRQFFLILSDINLPGLPGTELVKLIRSRESGSQHHTFVVALTGHVDEYSRNTCLTAGMDGYLTKPIDRLKLKEFVERVIKTSKQAATPAAAPK